MSGSLSVRTQLLIALGALFAVLAMLFAVNTTQAHAKFTIASKTYSMSSANDKMRFTVGCPGKLVPFGGGMMTPPPELDGEGIYPHSYERLGVQHGYHITTVLFDPSSASTLAHNVTLQVACSEKQAHVTPPHTTVQVNPGETKTAVATCPGRRQLFGGGFQRTDFTARGGDYVTESRAISSKAWAVTGTAHGSFGGEMTAIAYCWRSKKPLLSEVSASTTIPPGAPQAYGTATTPPCPGGRKLVFGGFSTSPGGPAFFTNGSFDPSGGWTASAYNFFGPSTNLTAYGYCLKV